MGRRAMRSVFSATGRNLRWLLRVVASGFINPFHFDQMLWQLIG
jgi:hypothetical protein